MRYALLADLDLAVLGVELDLLAAAADPAGGADARLAVDLVALDRQSGEVGVDAGRVFVRRQHGGVDFRTEARSDGEEDVPLRRLPVDVLRVRVPIGGHAEIAVARLGDDRTGGLIDDDVAAAVAQRERAA